LKTNETLSFAAILVSLGILFAPSAEADSTGGTEWSVHSDEIHGSLSQIGYERRELRKGGPKKAYLYTDSCYIADDTRAMVGCVDGRIPPPSEECPSGEWIRPRWSQNIENGAPSGPWTLEAGFTCPGDPEYPFQLEDLEHLQIPPSPLRIQPDSGWALTGIETVAYTENSPQGYLVELLGLDFYVAVVPVSFEWDFGDGTPPIRTSTPGAPWPDHTIAHVYEKAAEVRPHLNTSWKAYVRREGSPTWGEVPGTGQTTTVGPPITVYSARTRLVEDSLYR